MTMDDDGGLSVVVTRCRGMWGVVDFTRRALAITVVWMDIGFSRCCSDTIMVSVVMRS